MLWAWIFILFTVEFLVPSQELGTWYLTKKKKTCHVSEQAREWGHPLPPTVRSVSDLISFALSCTILMQLIDVAYLYSKFLTKLCLLDIFDYLFQ